MRTTAVLSRDPSAEFSIEPIEVDEPRAGEILVRIVAAGICHTDLVSRRAGAVDRPILLGHEGAGIVAAVGSDVRTVRPGDHVVLTFRHCGACRNCAAGRPAYCHRATALNQFGRRAHDTPRALVDGSPVLDGFFGQSSFAGYALTTEDNTIVIDPAIDLAVAAPFGCGFQTGAGAVLNALRPESGAWVAVYGAGAVGMAGLLAARSIPDVRVVVVETSAARRNWLSSSALTRRWIPPTGPPRHVSANSPTAVRRTRSIRPVSPLFSAMPSPRSLSVPRWWPSVSAVARHRSISVISCCTVR